jgi:acyl-CoA reductase-like NAD-dependent aldehyde dehydrogenase
MNFAATVQCQRAFFQSGATRPLEFRRTQLRKLQEAMAAQEHVLVAALHADLRKSPHEAYTTEIGLVASELRHALRHLPAWMKPRRRGAPLLAWPAGAFIRPEPYGVALIIGPWNYPLQLLLSPLVGAMAAGNCAVLKPSEFAPHTAAAIRQLISATFPAEYIAIVQGERLAAEALLREKFDTIFFTGSTSVGRAVMGAAARQLTPVTLELGGKCPCIVCADAPIEVTARRIAWGKFMNAGQTCVAPDFVLVERAVRDDLVRALKQAVREFYGEAPQQSPDYGRIINRRHFERLTGYLGSGRVVHGGQQEADDLYLAPTILTDVSPDAPVMQEEIFGPILPVLEFERLEDALARLRNRPIPLALYLFTKSRAIQESVLDGCRSGGVCLNDTVTHMVGKNLPFGGLGESGMGAYHGQASFDCFTHRRSVLRRSLAVDPKLRYPPPRISLATLKRAFRFLLGG